MTTCILQKDISFVPVCLLPLFSDVRCTFFKSEVILLHFPPGEEDKGGHFILLSVETIKHLTFCLEVESEEG